MAYKIKPIILRGFKTLNLDHPSLIDQDEWADTQNMVMADDGLWENRKGIKSFDNAVGSNKPVHSLHFWKPAPGVNRYLTVGSGTALYSYAESSEYYDGSFTSRQTGFTDGERMTFAQYADNLIATNGAEAMYSTTDNATWTIRNGANTRIAKHILFANDIGYCADINGARSVLYYGGAVPANPWEFANSVDIESDNGQVITGLSNLGPINITGKTRSIYDVDLATPARNQLDFGGGITSHRGIVKAANSVYVPAIEGVFTVAQRNGVSGSLQVTPMSDPISVLWRKITDKTIIPGIYFYPRQEVLWTVVTSEQTYTLVYNVKWNAWSYLIGANANDFTIYEDGDGTERLLYGDSGADAIRELFTEDRDDDGAPINSVLQTREENFGTDDIKMCHWIEVAGYGSKLMELDVDIYFDGDATPSKSVTIDSDNFASPDDSVSSAALGSSALGSAGLSGYIASSDDLDVHYWVKRIPLERVFRTVSVKMSNSQAGVRWRFKEIRTGVDPTAKDLTPSYIFN